MTDFLDILARNAISAALLAAVVLAVTLVVKRPAVRNALWLIVLIRLLIPPIWNVPLPEMKSDPAPIAVARIEPIAESPIIVAEVLSPASLPIAHEAMQPHFDVPKAREPAPPSIHMMSETLPVAASTGTATNALPNWLAPLLLALWIAGSFVVVALACSRIRRFQRGLVDACLAPIETQRQAADIAAQLGLKQSPPVWLVPGRLPPMLWMPGLIARKARLIFPVELFFKLDADQRGALIAHELAHLRRRDPWVRWLELLAVALYWWYPLLGFIRRRLRASEEQCCDAWVVSKFSERKAYATALMETVEFLDGPGRPAASQLASGVGPVHDLQRRLTMIMRGSMRGRLSRFGALAILAVAVGALAFGPAFSLAQPEEPKEKKEGRKGGFGKGGQGGPGGGFGPNREEILKVKEELDEARLQAEKAMKRVHELEEKMQKLFNGGGVRGGDGGPKGGRGGQGGDGPMPPKGDPFRGAPGGGGGAPGLGGQERQLQEMQKQIEELRRVLDEMRKEMQRGNDRPTPKFPMPERKEFRPFGGGGGGFPGGGGGGFPGRPGAEKGPEKLPPPPVKEE